MILYSFFYICGYLYAISNEQGIKFNKDSGIIYPLNCDLKLAKIFYSLYKISKDSSTDNNVLSSIIQDIYDLSCSYTIYKKGYFILDETDNRWILIRQLCSILLKKAY